MTFGDSEIDISNASDIIAQVTKLATKIATLEEQLIDVGVIEEHAANELLLGHRLAKAEQQIQTMQDKEEDVLLPMDAAWVLTCATLVFLMQLGFAQLESGMCRPKNVIATYMKNIIDFVLGSFCTLLVGYAIAYPQTPIIDQIDAWKFFFHLVFQATASTIVSGAMAERTDIKAYIILTTIISGIIYSFSVRWTWGGGFIAQMEPGFHDFAGSGVVHALGGSAALAGAYVVGPRLASGPEGGTRFDHPEEFVPHSVPQILSGVLLLWVGWYGFNPGSTGTMSSAYDAMAASNAAMTTTISASSSGLVVMLYHLNKSGWRHIKVMSFANGVLSGLVAVTAGCDVYSPWAAVFVGCGAAAVYTIAHDWMIKHKIDDVVDAAPVHGACGWWGCICVGLCHPEMGLLTNLLKGEFTPELLKTQIIGVAVLSLLGGVPIYIVCKGLDSVNFLRTSKEEEMMGLDQWVFQLHAYTTDYHHKKEMASHSGRPIEGYDLAQKVSVEEQRRNSARKLEGIELAQRHAGEEQVRSHRSDTNSMGRPSVGSTTSHGGHGGRDPTADPPSNLIAKFEGSKAFSTMVMTLQVLVICVLIGLQLRFKDTLETSTAGIDVSSPKDAMVASQLYNFYIGVSMMMFLGFGYLMTFLRWYGLGAIGLTMLITTLGIETSLVSQAFVALFTGSGSAFIIDLGTLLQANFAVAAFLISFGGLIGKVNPPQLVVMVVMETCFYVGNKYVLDEYVAINDVGGTVIIHMFGAYFGLVVAYMLGVPAINIKEKASYVSDLFSLLGTVILWVYWPSFVAGATPAGTPDSELQIVQTVLSLAAATVTTFACSAMLSDDGKLRPVDVQNATLAGGVSVGILASTPLTAAGALLVGSFAGALSTFGFAHVSPFLYEAIGLHDTCGINNLHGMPSLMGALISAGLPYVFPHITTFDMNTQLLGVGITLAVTLVSGVFTGKLMSYFADNVEMASDAYYWEVADDFSKVPEMDQIDVELRKQAARKTGLEV